MNTCFSYILNVNSGTPGKPRRFKKVVEQDVEEEEEGEVEDDDEAEEGW